MEDDSIPPLDSLGIKRFQGIVGALLYYARAVRKKLLIALISTGSQQASTTERTLVAITQLLAYINT